MKSTEFLSKFNEAEKDTIASEEINNVLRRKGYELLGSGVDATVWAKKDSPNVLKIIMPEHGDGAGSEAETFYRFYEFCKKNSNIDHLPRFAKVDGNEHHVFVADGKNYVMIGMERLRPIPEGSFAEAMVWILSDFATTGKSWEEVHDTIRQEKTWEKWYVEPEDYEYRKSDVMPPEDVLYNIDSWDDTDAAQWGVLYSLMRLLYHTGRINKQAWDLHTENAMMRGDTIVITDPWIASETA